ncbi:hypothetical protein [Nannocystis bainbridge]|uniref:Uncharacterized protein n=1 Tax=Nannocystis bainbridge TaxID=2995303 RepID=A0ABT5E0R0_9BACT|nr:hypothetical protein [Nannocystis bainbridge]MDC0718292.1 hypothetical protein [Nannocystis bainbridge]
MNAIEDELQADGEALLRRREAIERSISRDFRGSRAAVLVQVAQVERERERLRAELQRLVREVDEADPQDSYEDEDEAGAADGFYAARERLAARDRELVHRGEALQRRAAELRKAPAPAKLTELERERDQLESHLRQWRGRCRRAGLMLDLPRWGEFAGAAAED